MKFVRCSLLLGTLLTPTSIWAETPIEVFKSPYCGCSENWITNLQENGFKVRSTDVNGGSGQPNTMDMPDRYASCHTAPVGSYLIEGHVSAMDVDRVLRERPKALGLTVPSMPPGSLGMGPQQANAV